MQFCIIASVILMTVSFVSSMWTRLLKERFGFLPQVKKSIPKVQAYTKSVAPFSMGLAAILFFAAMPFVLVNLILFLIVISSYVWSSILAWREFSQYNLYRVAEQKISKQQIVVSLVGNILNVIIWVSTISFLVKNF